MLLNLSTHDGINHLNSALMVLSLVAAMFFPFELFLFSFVVLGPLHYLTEVSWLQKRNFFIKNQWESIFLIVLSLIATLLVVLPTKKTDEFITNIVFLGFVFAMIVLIVEQTWFKIFLLIAVLALVYFTGFYKAAWFVVIFGIFMSTIIHTTIFTGIFILSGIRKNTSVSGIISLAVFIICTVFFFIVPFDMPYYQVSSYAKEAFGFFCDRQ